MEGFVYILYSQKNNKYYIGSTTDPDRRFSEHNGGKNKSTKSGIPWDRVLCKQYLDIVAARRIEYRLKKLKNRKIIEQIIRDQDILLGQ